MYSFPNFEPVYCSMSSFNFCFLTYIQISQEASQVVWYSHLFKNFPQFVVPHKVKDFGVVNKAEVDVFLELYPKCVWVTWVRDKQEEPGTQEGEGDVTPNADWTWYLRVTLDVEAAEAAGLSCGVKHSSLRDQDVILYWGEEEVEPSWGWEDVVLKHRVWDTGRERI